MARGDNQELKLLWLVLIFKRKTDAEHMLKMSEIIAELAEHGVSANRHTVGKAIKMLRQMGLNVVMKRERGGYYYYLEKQDFELAELKLLADSVQSAKFITEETTKKLIRKIECLTSEYQGKQLQRNVYLTGRVKTPNMAVFDNVDKLHEAIRTGRQIRFTYLMWSINKEHEPELVPRREEEYQVSPFHLMNNDGNYYLVAYSKKDEEIRHYRVDKMQGITILEDAREGLKHFERFDLPEYARSVFGMYRGEEKSVVIEGANSMVGVMIDRFGKDNIIIAPRGDERFRIITNVVISNKFFEWVFALGDDVKVTGPPDVVMQMQEEIRRLARLYEV